MTMMKKKMVLGNGFFSPLLFCLLLFVSEFRVFASDASTTEECRDDFQKVMVCLDYARGKITTPSKECCSSVKGIKDSDPKCLCYIIQQAHGGSETLKNLGVQEAKLLQLPSACQLQNASMTNCPKLLGLSPSSPDAAIFTNTSSLATPNTGTTSAPEKADDSMGNKHVPHLVWPTVMVALAIFFSAVPSGSAVVLK